MLVAFNKIDLPAAAEAWPAFQRGASRRGARRRGHRRRRRERARRVPRRASRRCCRRSRSWPSHPTRPASSSTASRRWPTASRSSATRTVRSGSAASASSGSPRRPTSTSRSRPSGSSATSTRLGIDAELRRAGDRRRRPVRIGGDRARVGVTTPGRTGERRIAGAAERSGCSAGRSTRSISRISRWPRRRATPWVSTSSCSCRPGSRRTSRTWRSRRRTDRLAMVRGGDRRQPGLRREHDGDRARRAVVHGRHAGGPGGAARDRGWLAARHRADPVGRGCRRAGRLARPERVLELATLVVAPRDGFPDLRRRLPGRARARAPRRGSSARRSAPAAVAPRTSGVARRPVGRSATSSRMRSRPTSATMRCTVAQHRHADHGGPIDRDRTPARRVVGHPRRRRRRSERRMGCPIATARSRRPTGSPLDLARRIVELAEDKKAADIVLLDLTPLTSLADYFVICSGGSERQLDAIADGIVVEPARREDATHRTRGDGRLALGPARLRQRHRPHLHATRARLLRAREALGRGEDDPARAVGPAARAPGRVATRVREGTVGGGTVGSCRPSSGAP